MSDIHGGVVHDNPEYLFNILRERDPLPPENSGNSRPSWCICTFCREMPTQPKRLSRKIAFQDCLNHQDILMAYGFNSHARGRGQEQCQQTHGVPTVCSLASWEAWGWRQTDESSKDVEYGAQVS